MTKALSAFYNHLLPQLPGCMPELLDNELMEVLRAYTQTSRCWSEEFALIVPSSGVLEYDLDPSTSRAEVCGITQVVVGGVLWWRSRKHQPPCDGYQSGALGSPRYREDEPPFSCSDDFKQIVFDEVPAANVNVWGWLRPAYTMTLLPDLLFDQHLRAVRAGVFARLMAMPSKPWTNLDLASYHATNYTSLANAAAADAARGNVRAPLRTGKSFI